MADAIRVVKHDGFMHHYQQTDFALHLPQFAFLTEDSIAMQTESEITSSGFVLATLHASLWCLLRETSYAATVLQGVNLGGDTDTTACVVGGLAGLVYGRAGIPDEWVQTLARREDLESFFATFAIAVLGEMG